MSFSHDKIELLERTALEMVVQALADYLKQSVRVFREETDKAQDIAEDVMREAIESMGISGFQERLYGKVDYKKAIYVFVPEPVPVALMLDAKGREGQHLGDNSDVANLYASALQAYYG